MAQASLDKSEDEILALIEEGKIRHALHLERPGSRRRLIRIFALSLADYANATNHGPLAFENVVRYLVPGSAEALPASRLARTLCVGGTHLANLVRDGCLVRLKAGRYTTESPLISRASVVKWLTLRQIV
jgi:hypothetical protein